MSYFDQNQISQIENDELDLTLFECLHSNIIPNYQNFYSNEKFNIEYETEFNTEEKTKETSIEEKILSTLNEVINKNDIESNSDNDSEEKKKIFYCKKINKDKGRRKKENNLPKTHNDKFRLDNVIQKIKRKFTYSLRKSINTLYNKYRINRNLKPISLLQKIKPIFANIGSYKETLQYMQKTVKDMFSEELSDKIYKSDKNYNKIMIDKICEENEAKEVIKILNLTLKEMYDVYIGINNEINIPGFGLIYDKIEIIKNESAEYAERYSDIALNLFEHLKNSRKK